MGNPLSLLEDSVPDLTREEKKRLFIKELKQKYKNLSESVQPIPYIREKLLHVNKIFVEGGIEVRKKDSWVYLASHRDIFSDALSSCSRRIVQGDPGYGKSTLALQCAQDWCSSSFPNDVEILILLPFRQLFLESLCEAIRFHILPSESYLQASDIEHILARSSSVVMILDGLDEYSMVRSNASEFMKIITTPIFHNIEVLVTTRYFPQHRAPATQLLRLTGFEEEAQNEYIRKAISSDGAAIRSIRNKLNANPILDDLCQVPLIFVMFAHLSHEIKDFKHINTATKFFQHMMRCFHGHIRNKMQDNNPKLPSYKRFEHLHNALDEIAFESLSQPQQQLTWRRQVLQIRLGEAFYDYYVKTGILVEDQVYENVKRFVNPSRNEGEKEVRFYHKLFCEWYAAHYAALLASKTNDLSDLKRLFRFMEPEDLQYFYRFACGINRNGSGRIIECVKKKKGGDKLAILCLLEHRDQTKSMLNSTRKMCIDPIEFEMERNRLLQKSFVQILQIASSNRIPIACLLLKDSSVCFELRDGNLELLPKLSLPVLCTLMKLSVIMEGRVISPSELSNILLYASACPWLKELWFTYCLLPSSVPVDYLSSFKPENVEVYWHPDFLSDYRLNFQTGQWKHLGGTMTDSEYKYEEKKFKDKYGDRIVLESGKPITDEDVI